MHDTIPAYSLSLEQVAAELNVCTRTVRNRLKRRSDIAPNIARKVGRYWRFSPEVFASAIALPG